MHHFTFILIVVGVVLTIAVATWWFSADQKTRRAMRNVPRRSIRDVIEGEVARVVGKAEVAAPVQAPLTGRSCAYWRVLVQQYRHRGRSGRWETLVDEHDGVDFIVDDGSARALIETAYVQPVLDRDADFSSGMFKEPTPELARFLEERGHSTQGLLFNKRLRYREGVVEHGEHVTAVGVGRWERDPDAAAQAGAGYRSAELPERLVLHAPEQGPLLLSDEPEMMA